IVLLLGFNVIVMFPPKLLGNDIDVLISGAFTADGLLFYIGIFFVLTSVVYIMSYFWLHKLFGGAILMERILRTMLMG
ncbi:multidrug ABC transporter permease/ATP-binding protein, partial [Bacillus vallismortis]|nr:multidrug ABC transporter permease/ATP-binding protein [Bacillus vallismortis]